jgi:nucleotide-binding universal stress UspA family protein
MLPFRQILFPVDFSAQSLGAARYVEAFAGRFDSELTILHVIDLPSYDDLVPQSPAERRTRLVDFLVKEFQYIRVNRLVVEGDPARNILRVAQERGVDLIMMPTHGRGPFRRFLLGSVAGKILHDADCPVWTGVHLESAPPLERIEFRRLLCAVNAEEHAASVIAAAREFAAEYGAGLTVLHVAQSSAGPDRVRQMAGKEIPVLIETGDVMNTVADTARRLSADLVIIGRSPSPGVFGRLRQHAYPIIRQSPCPVISI